MSPEPPETRPPGRGSRTVLAALLLSLGLFGLWELLDAALLGNGSMDPLRVLRGSGTALLVVGVVLVLGRRARSRHEHLLGRGREYLERLTRSSPEAIVTTDLRGRIAYVSQAACDLTGWAEADLLHRRASEIYREGKAEAERLARKLREEGEVCDAEVDLLGPDGEPVSVLLSVSMLSGPDGRPVGTLAIARAARPATNGRPVPWDAVTAAAIQELAGSIAHEVRNPLAGIRGAMQLWRSRSMPPDEDAVVTEILGQIHRLDGMVQDLVAFARPMQADPKPVSLRAMAERAVARVHASPTVAGVETEVDLEDDPSVLADESLMMKALRIVLENAAHAVGGHGIVRVDAEREEGTVILRVHDSGPGIPENVQADVFRPFFTTKHKGSGLGLAIAYRVMEAHGGTIDFDCPPEGGTVFRLGLPAVPGP